jgi:hypothetical protein
LNPLGAILTVGMALLFQNILNNDELQQVA